MPKVNSDFDLAERARVNLIIKRHVWGKIKSEAFEQRKTASALINDSFEEFFRTKKKGSENK